MTRRRKSTAARIRERAAAGESPDAIAAELGARGGRHRLRTTTYRDWIEAQEKRGNKFR